MDLSLVSGFIMVSEHQFMDRSLMFWVFMTSISWATYYARYLSPEICLGGVSRLHKYDEATNLRSHMR